MPTYKYSVDNRRLTSTWLVEGGKVKSGPTTATFTFQTDIKIASGAKNIKVKFYCTLDGRENFQLIKFGNTSFKKDSVTVSIQKVKVNTTNVSVICACKATAKSGAQYEGQQSADLDVQNACFEVSWTGAELPATSMDVAAGKFQRTNGLFPSPSQDVFIYDKYVEQFLFFDGVIKVQLSNQVSIEDDTSNQKKKSNYVNNAKDDPDEITLQVMESNVYTNSSKFQGDSGNGDSSQSTQSRAAATYAYLYSLKEARRRVDVYTRLKLFEDFVIKSISVSLDENNTDGWSGSIVLHEYVSGTTTSSSGTAASDRPINWWALQLAKLLKGQ